MNCRQSSLEIWPTSDRMAIRWHMSMGWLPSSGTDRQREAIAIAVAEFKRWFKEKPSATAEVKEREGRELMAAIAGLRREYDA